MKTAFRNCPKCNRLTLQVRGKIPRWKHYTESIFKVGAWYCLKCHTFLVKSDKDRPIDPTHYDTDELKKED